MDIQGAAFDSEDPDSWGFTQDERRVWGVAVHGGRVYYAVGEAAEIWSVGLTRDGAFAGDPRWELTVEADKDLAVTDIAFDNQGLHVPGAARRDREPLRLFAVRRFRQGRGDPLLARKPRRSGNGIDLGAGAAGICGRLPAGQPPVGGRPRPAIWL